MKRKTKQRQRTVLVATGASGGHMFPALAAAEALREQGVHCVFVVGGEKFIDLVTARGFAVERLPASAFNVRNPIRKLKALLNLLRAVWCTVTLIHKYNPSVVFGTGGYATVAAVLGAKLHGVPAVIHEQNVLPGRANKLLARWADRVLLTFEKAKHHLCCSAQVVRVCGNPLRKGLVDAAQNIQRKSPNTFNILVLGGSQGARVLSEVVPNALSRLSEDEQKQVTIYHQARPEDLARVQDVYASLNLAYVRVESFVEDMAQALIECHVLISRAGTGAVVEAALFGRAAIYIPHQLADNHQLYNAQVAEDAGAAIILEQPLFTSESLLPHLRHLMEDRDRLQDMENRARTFARPDAAKCVADAVLSVAEKDVMTMKISSSK